MIDDETAVTLVNLNVTEARTVTVQGGGYGEHRIRSVTIGEARQAVDAATFTVILAPGSGARLVLAMDRYVNPPTLRFPWSR
ncbi:hypothetical protein [Brevundimonas sp.]|uniref:hypothetical protein n=1 Tax=Brevundimonas sp. TaxID=1871086 RepID=UPI002628C56C|nr:hypothetical protein [Brevundimonas sp.]